MEGAAFSLLCKKRNWLVVKSTDEANENASSDFTKFLSEYKLKSFDLIKCVLNTL